MCGTCLFIQNKRLKSLLPTHTSSSWHHVFIHTSSLGIFCSVIRVFCFNNVQSCHSLYQVLIFTAYRVCIMQCYTKGSSGSAMSIGGKFVNNRNCDPKLYRSFCLHTILFEIKALCALRFIPFIYFIFIKNHFILSSTCTTEET